MAGHIICFVSFRFVSFCFVSFRSVSFRFVSFHFDSFRFCFVSHFTGTHDVVALCYDPNAFRSSYIYFVRFFTFKNLLTSSYLTVVIHATQCFSYYIMDNKELTQAMAWLPDDAVKKVSLPWLTS